MSVTHVKRITGTRGSVAYQLYGTRGTAKYKRHRAKGTTRAAAMICDLESPEAFVERAEYLRETHGRTVEARSIIHSFERTEFDPSNQDDVNAVAGLGYEFAKRLHPNSDVLVVVHTDGRGGHPHSHITVINHDNMTGKALQGNHLHWMISKVNDTLMREWDLRVTKRGDRLRDASQTWDWYREGDKVTEWERSLGDRIEAALQENRAVDIASFRSVLRASGVALRQSEHTIKASKDGRIPEHNSIGWAYAAAAEPGARRAERRRKASSLAPEFQRNAVLRHLEKRRQAQLAATSTPSQATTATTTKAAAFLDDLFAKTRADIETRGDQHRAALKERLARERILREADIEAREATLAAAPTAAALPPERSPDHATREQAAERESLDSAPVPDELSSWEISAKPAAERNSSRGSAPKWEGIGAAVRDEQVALAYEWATDHASPDQVDALLRRDWDRRVELGDWNRALHVSGGDEETATHSLVESTRFALHHALRRSPQAHRYAVFIEAAKRERESALELQERKVGDLEGWSEMSCAERREERSREAALETPRPGVSAASPKPSPTLSASARKTLEDLARDKARWAREAERKPGYSGLEK